MYNTTLTVQVQITENEETIICFFTKNITLPFAPFPGLTINLDENLEDIFDVQEITWDNTEQKFYLECGPDHQDNRPETTSDPQNIDKIVDHYRKQGWELVENDQGPFLGWHS